MAKRYSETADVGEHFDEEDMDAIKAVMAYMLIKGTDLETEMIYSLVFRNGQRITWH